MRLGFLRQITGRNKPLNLCAVYLTVIIYKLGTDENFDAAPVSSLDNGGGRR